VQAAEGCINLQLPQSNSGTLSLWEFHERYWSPDFKIGRSFRGCHFNCRSRELLWTHGRSCIHLIGDHVNAIFSCWP
ncbi:Os04g0194800, partial [Oryza sativa Japonica Group]